MNTTRWPHSRTPHQRNGGAGGVADEVQPEHGDRSACFEVPPVAQASRTFAHFRQMRIQRHRPFAPDSRHSGKAVAVRKSHDTIVILVPFSRHCGCDFKGVRRPARRSRQEVLLRAEPLTDALKTRHKHPARRQADDSPQDETTDAVPTSTVRSDFLGVTVVDVWIMAQPESSGAATIVMHVGSFARSDNVPTRLPGSPAARVVVATVSHLNGAPLRDPSR